MGRGMSGLQYHGFSVASPSLQGIFISRIAEGGAAHRAGTLQVGDRVLSVSGAGCGLTNAVCLSCFLSLM
jgi:hypothetical protein